MLSNPRHASTFCRLNTTGGLLQGCLFSPLRVLLNCSRQTLPPVYEHQLLGLRSSDYGQPCDAGQRGLANAVLGFHKLSCHRCRQCCLVKGTSLIWAIKQQDLFWELPGSIQVAELFNNYFVHIVDEVQDIKEHNRMLLLFTMCLHLRETRHIVLSISLREKFLNTSTNTSSGKAVYKTKLILVSFT